MQQELDDIKKSLAELEKQMALVTLKVNKINRKMIWGSVYSFLQFLLIVAPIIWAYFAFQPQIKELYTSYGTIMNQIKTLETVSKQGTSSGISPTMLQELQQQYPQYFKK